MAPATFAAAQDTVEEKLHAARKAVNATVRDVEDLRDSAVVGIRRAPFTAIGAAFGVGIFLGAAIGWLSSRPCRE